MTLGVRAVIHDPAANAVLLVRHTYVPGWQFPGGGVETGETMLEALARELREEAEIGLTAPPLLRSVHFNRGASRRDHVALYLATSWERLGTKLPDLEIAEAGFFALDALPEAVSPATRRRLDEIFGGREVSSYW